MLRTTLRTIALTTTLYLLASSLAVAADCDRIGNDAVEIGQIIAAGDTKSAVKQAEKLAEREVDCVEAQLLLATTLNARLDMVGGLKALSVSKKYRRAIAAALDIDPNNVDARTEEIGYLIAAPSIAGGSREKAAVRIAELRTVDPLAAAQMQLSLSRAGNDPDAVISSLQTLVNMAHGDYGPRSELARRLILAGRTDEADRELSSWAPDLSPDAWVVLEHQYLRAATRVYGGFELDIAEALLRQFIEARGHLDHPRLPSIAKANALIGSTYEGRGDFDKASDAYQATLRDDPDNQRAQDGLARISERRGE